MMRWMRVVSGGKMIALVQGIVRRGGDVEAQPRMSSIGMKIVFQPSTLALSEREMTRLANQPQSALDYEEAARCEDRCRHRVFWTSLFFHLYRIHSQNCPRQRKR